MIVLKWSKKADRVCSVCATAQGGDRPSCKKARFDVVDKFMMASILVVVIYFNIRLLIEPILSREVFTAIYGPIVVLLGCIEALRLKNTTPGRKAVLIYCFYLVCRAAVSVPWPSIVLISIFQYFVPVWCFFFGIRLWASGRARLVIAVFLVTLAVSDLAGMANYFGGFLAPLFQGNVSDNAMVGEEILSRCGSLAGGSIGTGELSSIGILLALGSSRWTRLLIPIYVVTSILTLSRGGIVMIGVGLSLWAFIVMRSRFVILSRSIPAILIGCSLALAVLVSLSIVFPEIRDLIVGRYLSDMFNTDEVSNEVRIQSWIMAFQMWWNHPIWGNGFGLLGGSVVKNGLSVLAPESMYLKYMGELGIVGLIVYLVALWRPVAGAWARVTKCKATENHEVEAVLCSVIVILAGGVFLQNLEYDFMAIIFWLLLGMLAGAGSQDLRGGSFQRRTDRIRSVCCETPS